ncbi:MAG: hypothetical protein HRU31_02420 [Rhodobacteraceae bacterium]|nr:hypothetical protein [Paracoccaceae bacterium]
MTWEDHTIYGLTLRCDQVLPGLRRGPGRTDTLVTLQTVPSDGTNWPEPPGPMIYRSGGEASPGQPFLSVWPGPGSSWAAELRCVDAQGGVRFLISADGAQIRAELSRGYLLLDGLAYLLGPVIGAVLRLRRIPCLHAAVLRGANGAFAIIGPKGMGKSTLAAFCASRGVPVLSDDVAVLGMSTNGVRVDPGYPRLRLWPNTLRHLGHKEADHLPRILRGSEKRFLDLETNDVAGPWRYESMSQPLRAIFRLSGRGPDDAFSIEPMQKSTALIELAANGYPHFNLAPTETAWNFGQMRQVVDLVPVKQVSLPDGIDHLPQVAEALLSEVA